ncbi:hypothetical protein [Dyella caseinilytica]|uniref:Curlin associated repeat-containing protein n=1 Tax=Dyella caseinilytica TaxID=1849581 RepID=A0ABX7GUT6_9GAMM|nr:hypothetical protein [Dyella caseinilytica]QRN54221.1 hypothetical protein ISN74_02145 [Dyella caseinilytica]GFZ92453.1 hypothetical protein GCM10011408_10040 [Dyella caseinilytica]
MTRTLRYFAVCAAGSLVFATCPAAFAQSTPQDSYATILSYLDSNTIGGNALEGTDGVTSVNTAAGNANLQGNLHAFAIGNQAQALIQAQQHERNDSPGGTLYANATIGGHAYDNGQGIASINQVSGNSNTQLNGVAVALANQGIREATDGTLSAAVSASAGGQASSNPHAQAGGTRSVSVDPSAMEGFNGVMQLNQVAGSGNASDNLLLLSAPPSSH